MTSKNKFFDFSKINQSSTLNPKYLLLLKVISSFPAYKKMQKWHDAAIVQKDFCDYLQSVLYQMHVNIKHVGELNIPTDKGVIFVANHPTGLLEVIVWLYTILKTRQDLKMMANNWFDLLDVAKNNIISVNPFEDKTSYKQNVKGFIAAKAHLENGGALMLFPAGEVAHWNWKTKAVTDPPWKKSILKLSEKTGAPIIPCYSSSKNSMLFNIVGNIHPRLRTLMLAREFTSKQRKTICIATNAEVNKQTLDKYLNDAQKMAFLRLSSEALNEKPFAEHLQENEEIISKVSADLVEQDLSSLKILNETDEYTVLMGGGRQTPNLLREIGRLREYNFRLIGEGSGNSLDLDKYDDYYQQIVLWHKSEKRILGGLRFYYGDQLEQRGLYFLEYAKVKPKFIPVLKQSLDFGRLFVVDDVPDDLNVILILVRNLVAYFKSSNYNYLLGQVSIPSAYPKMAIDIILSFLQHSHLNNEFCDLVNGKRTYKITKKHKQYIEELLPVLNNPKAVNVLLSKLFQGRIEIPALLRFYLKCNTKLMNVNHDKDFGTVDALMILHRDEIPKFFK